MNNKVIGWWSGGIASAVTCKLIIDLFGLENCRFIFIDTFNEDEDTYRFKKDCEKWYGKEIETITRIGKKYDSIQDVWHKYKSLNVAGGAVCSSELKRELRKEWQKENEFKHQAFGFDLDEVRRVKSMVNNYRDKTKALVFLKPHKDYPHIKDISMMSGREPKPLMDCNGLACGVTDLDQRNETENEINYQTKLF